MQMAEHLPTSIGALFPDGGLRQAELFAEIEAAIHAVLASGDLLGKMTPNPITGFNSRRSYERRPAQRGHPDGRGGVSIHATLASGDVVHKIPDGVEDVSIHATLASGDLSLSLPQPTTSTSFQLTLFARAAILTEPVFCDTAPVPILAFCKRRRIAAKAALCKVRTDSWNSGSEPWRTDFPGTISTRALPRTAAKADGTFRTARFIAPPCCSFRPYRRDAPRPAGPRCVPSRSGPDGAALPNF